MLITVAMAVVAFSVAMGLASQVINGRDEE